MLSDIKNENIYNDDRWFTSIFTEESLDYIGLSRLLSFAACDKKQCVDVEIVDDLVDEPQEKFVITLERTPDLNSRIMLDPVDEEIFIQDNGKLANMDIKY